MVAYGFKKQFVDPILSGLGYYEYINGMIPRPKRQTIRAIGKRRHARPGEILQLYTAMRTKQCEKIGDARCVSVDPIRIKIPLDDAWLWVQVANDPAGPATDAFAQTDGFESVEDMWLFWRKEHPDARLFKGVLIQWEPI